MKKKTKKAVKKESPQLSMNMLLCNFTKKLEEKVRKKFNVDPNTQIYINWADDYSCVWDIIIGNVNDVFSYISCDKAHGLTEKLFDAERIEVTEHTYWPMEDVNHKFEKLKKEFNITDPEINCGAKLPPDALKIWNYLWNERSIVEITPAKKK